MAHYRRRNLPHLEHPDSTYFLTFRLAGSIPQKVIDDWKFERKEMILVAQRQKRELSEYEVRRVKYLFSDKVEKYLDESYGECWLRNPTIARLVVNAIKYFDGSRYHLHAWCVMPNHVVFTVISRSDKSSDLIPILHSWKSFTAHRANRILDRTGIFWQPEYYDRLIRSDEEFAHYIDYTLHNPVKARLCLNWLEWSWGDCSEEIRKLIV